MQKDISYKNSNIKWIGEIPYNWKVLRGKFLFESRKEINKSMVCNNILSLTMNGVIHRDELGEGGLLPSDYSTFQIFYPNDLVFKLIDLENFKTSRVGIVNEKGIMSSAYIRIFSKKNYIYPKYFYYFYFNLYTQGIFNFIGMGVRSTMNSNELLNLQVIIPSYGIQQKIADFLDKKTKIIDQIIEKKKKLIELLKELRISIITKAVTKGLDPNAKMKPSGVEWIGEIPEGWDMKRLRFLIKINPSKLEIKHYKDISVSFLPMSLVSELGEIDFSDIRNLNSVIDSYTYFNNRDVILAKITPCFENYKGAIVDNLTNGIGFGSSEFFVLRPSRSIDSSFLYYLTMTHSFRNIGELEMRGTAGQQRITSLFLKNYICHYPDLEMQKKISNYLKKITKRIDLIIKKLENQIDYFIKFRSSLIYYAVTGKIKSLLN